MDFHRIGIAIERESVFARRVLTGLVSALPRFKERGFDFDLRFLYDSLARNKRELDDFDGFIAQVQNPEMARALTATGKPVVDVLYKQRYENCAVVNPDNHAIARLVVEHLLSRRFRHFAFCGREGVFYSDDRCRAFKKLLADAGFEMVSYTLTPRAAHEYFLGKDPRKELKVEDPLDAANLRRWVKQLPSGTAVFCCQDLRAYQLLRICKEEEIQIPSHIALVGVDDDPIFCHFTTPRLSSVNPDAERVGDETLELLAMAFTENRPLAFADSRFIEPRALSVRESSEIFSYDPPWLGEALAYIYRHISENLSAEDVYRAINKSHTVVDRYFRMVLGTSVQKIIIKTRLERAAFLLKTTDLPIKTILRQSGYSSFSYFCTSFSRFYGITAEEYRERKSCGI